MYMKSRKIALVITVILVITILGGCAPVVTTNPPAAGTSATPDVGTGTGTTLITEDEAKKIALDDAQLTEEQITAYVLVLDTDDGRQEYEIEFYVGTTEYEYEIDAVTGKINSKDIDKNG